MKEIGIGLLGFGTIGSGVVEGLRRNEDVIAERLGVRPVIRGIADIDVESDRGIEVDPDLLSQDGAALIENPAVDVVVELIGGTGAARDFVIKALEMGKPVVTANKALLAEFGREIFELAAKSKVDIYFGASVGGGIPIIRALREGLAGNRIESIIAILNGTCNYILTRMDREGLPFNDALKEAQNKGYAEADPALDIEGDDTAHKAVILASLAYGFYVPMDQVHIEGIADLSIDDIRYALDLGYRIKMLAVIKRDGDRVEVRVHPTLVALDHVLASVNGVFNAVMVHGDMAGDTLYYGRGAGREPTASTVIADIMDVARNIVSESPRRVPAIAVSGRGFKVKSMDEIESRYYLRLSLMDKPGVFAAITSELGGQGISIASVLQKEERSDNYVPVVIVTHQAKEKDMDNALAKIDESDFVGEKTVKLRIEE